MSTHVGEPWPEARFGEVRSPDGTRAYLALTAGSLAGRGDKWARSLARAGHVAFTRGHVPGRQGPQPYFLDADSFEDLGREQGWWPPSDSDAALASTADRVLATATSARIRDLESRVDALQHELAEVLDERDELLSIVHTLTRQATRRRASPDRGHQRSSNR